MNKKITHMTSTLILLITTLCGCAPWVLITPTNQTWQSGVFSGTLPDGWVRYRHPDYVLFLTRDGILLNRVTIASHTFEKELPFTKKKLSPEMLPQELAELIIDEMSLNQDYLHFVVIENKPVKLDGRNTFAITYEYTTQDFVTYTAIEYGIVVANRYYDIVFTATKQHYFNATVEDFTRFTEGLLVTEK